MLNNASAAEMKNWNSIDEHYKLEQLVENVKISEGLSKVEL